VSRRDGAHGRLPEDLDRLVCETVAASRLQRTARDEFESELRAHVEDALAAGVEPAVLASRFGDPLRTGRAVARARGAAPVPPNHRRVGMESIWRTIRHGARSLAKSPVFTWSAVLLIALGVTIASALTILMGVALVSSWLPARQAAATDPMEVLRGE
jgi:hypothetical protein